ncbi:MAG: 2-phosphosulfolactate phosphatase [Kosmotogaceae bacterium]
MDIDVFFTPEEELKSELSVVVDVLRATSVISTLIELGCEKIIPVSTVEEAFRLKKRYPDFLLAGERNSMKISGFDYGNSPLEYDSNIQEKTLILTTTNGTKAILKSKNCKQVLIGSLLNIDSIIKTITKSSFKTLNIVCSGTNGELSLEDIYCAGMIASNIDGNLTDRARLTSAFFSNYKDCPERVLSEISSHGRKLVLSGFAGDTIFCAKINLYKKIPFYRNGLIQELKQ